MKHLQLFEQFVNEEAFKGRGPDYWYIKSTDKIGPSELKGGNMYYLISLSDNKPEIIEVEYIEYHEDTEEWEFTIGRLSTGAAGFMLDEFDYQFRVWWNSRNNRSEPDTLIVKDKKVAQNYIKGFYKPKN